MDFKSFFKSKNFKTFLVGLGVLIVLLFVFRAGEAVGFRKANFSYRWGENYYRGFAGPQRGALGFFGGSDFSPSHGIFGSIIKTSTSTLFVESSDGTEKQVLLGTKTIIKRFRETISETDLKVGDKVIIIGSPNDSGEIEAQLVRVMPASSSSIFGPMMPRL